MTSKLRSWLKVRFLAGFFVTVPVVATAWLLWVFWNGIDDLFSPGYERIIGRRVPGLGFLTAVLLLFLIGTIATNVVGRKVLQWAERVLLRIPVFRSVYPSVKQLIEGFSPERRGGFKEVVLAQHPREGSYVFGFLTGEVEVETPEGKHEMVSVFVPTNNLYLGDVILVKKSEVIRTDLTIEEGIRIILSAGTGAPRRIRPKHHF